MIESEMLMHELEHPNTWGKQWQLHLGISSQLTADLLMQKAQVSSKNHE